MLALLAAPAVADAAVRNVSTTGADAADCAGGPCHDDPVRREPGVTGDTVRVAAGTYTGGVVTTKALTFEGAQAGTDARGRAGAETTVTANGILGGLRSTAAAAVVVDGFSFVDNDNYGVILQGTTSGHAIRNNIFSGNQNGLFMQTDGAQQTTVTHNSFADNGNDGIASGVAGTGTSNALISENDFTGHAVGAVVLSGAGGDDVEIRGNNMVDDSSIAAFGTSNLVIADNTSQNPTGTSIYIGGGNAGVTVARNTLTANGASAAVKVDNALGEGLNSGVRIDSNDIRSNWRSASGRPTEPPADTVVARNNTLTGNTTGAVNDDNGVSVDALQQLVGRCQRAERRWARQR